jgi:hypothetical protein
MFHKATQLAAAGGALLIAACSPAAVEPTAADMRTAFEGELGARMVRKPNGDFVIESPLNGMALRIKSFDKLGCKEDEKDPGYRCTYRVAMSMGVFTNENVAAAEDHASAVNSLMGMMGAQNVVETQTNRFLVTDSGWVMVILK